MPVKIRLQRKGRRKRPFYHIVVADSRSPRDGRYIERIGSYNPMTSPATIEIDRDKAYEWLVKGAQPTDTARAILRFKGVYYRKHLMRGVQKGAMTMEEAEAKYEQWITEKEAKVEERRRKQEEEKKEYHKKLSGEAPALDVTVADEPVEEEAAEAEEAAAESGKAEQAADADAEAAEEKAGAEAEAKGEASEEEARAEEAETPAEDAKASEEEAPAEEAEQPAEEAKASEEEAPAEEAEQPAEEEKK